MNYFEQVSISKPAGVSDGYEGGLRVFRNAFNLTGGTHGHVSTATTIESKIGANVTGFEWNLLAKLDNYSNFGENCAIYSQANKFGNGNTWGACFEACDTTSGDNTGLVGTEIDCWITGPDNGLRWGLDVVVGDSLQIRENKKSANAIATYGIRIGASGSSPWAKWGHGMHIVDFLHSGIHLQSKSTRGIHLEGEYIVALDLAQTKGQTSIRLPHKGRVTFDEYDQVAVSRVDNKMVFTNGGVEFFSVDINTGDIYKKGVKVL